MSRKKPMSENSIMAWIAGGILAVIAFILFVIAPAAPANAHPLGCFTGEVAMDYLSKRGGKLIAEAEIPRSGGPPIQVRVWEETDKTFHISTTDTNTGATCFQLNGDNFRMLDKPVPLPYKAPKGKLQDSRFGG